MKGRKEGVLTKRWGAQEAERGSGSEALRHKVGIFLFVPLLPGAFAHRFSDACGKLVLDLMLQCGAYKFPEERMGFCGTRLQLRVELAADEPWMVRYLCHLDKFAVGG